MSRTMVKRRRAEANLLEALAAIMAECKPATEPAAQPKSLKIQIADIGSGVGLGVGDGEETTPENCAKDGTATAKMDKVYSAPRNTNTKDAEPANFIVWLELPVAVQIANEQKEDFGAKQTNLVFWTRGTPKEQE